MTQRSEPTIDRTAVSLSPGDIPHWMRCTACDEKLLIDTGIPIGGGETLMVYLSILQRTIAISDQGWTFEDVALCGLLPTDANTQIGGVGKLALDGIGRIVRHEGLLFNPETHEIGYLASTFAEAIAYLPNMVRVITKIRHWVGVA